MLDERVTSEWVGVDAEQSLGPAEIIRPGTLGGSRWDLGSVRRWACGCPVHPHPADVPRERRTGELAHVVPEECCGNDPDFVLRPGALSKPPRRGRALYVLDLAR